MDAETLKALQGGIEKWKAVVAGNGDENGHADCPLCDLFYYGGSCHACPINLYSGNAGCYGTPYVDWNDHRLGYHDIGEGPRTPGCDRCLELAQRELWFLQNLLPEGATDAKV